MVLPREHSRHGRHDFRELGTRLRGRPLPRAGSFRLREHLGGPEAVAHARLDVSIDDSCERPARDLPEEIRRVDEPTGGVADLIPAFARSSLSQVVEADPLEAKVSMPMPTNRLDARKRDVRPPAGNSVERGASIDRFEQFAIEVSANRQRKRADLASGL